MVESSTGGSCAGARHWAVAAPQGKPSVYKTMLGNSVYTLQKHSTIEPSGSTKASKFLV